ncbi:MAG: HEAT repeat domain-containing protein, partial [Elainellaceae cyanobacterium]
MTPLEELLQQCTVKITVPGGWGTGFFVASGLVLTCAHVVRRVADAPIALFYAARGVSLSAIATASADDGQTLDLALLKLSEPLPDHPCVLLDEEPVAIGQELYSYGYLQSYPHAAPVRPIHEGWTGDKPPLLKLQGAQIEAGISGAALLNLRTGKVCGMVKETRAAGFDLGGGAIPTRVILEQFPALRELQRAFHEGDRRWSDVLVKSTPTEGMIQTNFGGHNYQTRTGANNTNYFGENHIYHYATPQPEASSSAGKIDVQPYLNSVVTTYEKWWQYYTLTDAESKQRQKQESAPIFDFGLMVQTVPKQEREQEQQEKEKVERFSVLDGLRKYALGDKPEPVLLVGRPGSGKSTALAKLLLEEATQASEVSQKSEFFKNSDFSTSLRIPILVELRYWQGSIAQLIVNALKRHDLAVTTDQLETVLEQSLLLFDGVNELPSEEARTQLSGFRRDHPKVPMIFTTRDLSLGGDLGIERKLEMQPLTEPQMRAFIQAYVPEQAEAMLKQLKDRLREFGQTPLLLWMLCSLFQQTQTIPQNLGEVFRAFTQGYERKLKQDVVVESDRRLWPELLKVLAARMMQGEKPTELRVAIAPSEIYHIFADYLQSPDPLAPRKALDDLLKHHLLQRNGELVEFRHQLLQEYYAAEWLLGRLEGLDDLTLQREYLNYLKWTEPLALMLALVTDEALAVRVVEQALAVDLRLGARLAGEVKWEFQAKTVPLIQHNKLHNPLKLLWIKLGSYPTRLPSWLLVQLFTKRVSEVAIPSLVKALEDPDWNLRRRAAEVLGTIGSEVAIPSLIKALKDSNLNVYRSAAEALVSIDSEVTIPRLLKAIEDSDYYIRRRAAEVLGIIGSEAAIPSLIKALKDLNWDVRRSAAEALGAIGSEAAIPGLLKALEDSDEYVRRSAAKVLGAIGSEAAIPGLFKALEDSDRYARRSAAEALGVIVSEAAIPSLFKALEDSDEYVRRSAAEALGVIGSEAAIPGLFKALEDSDRYVRRSVAEALGVIGSEAVIPGLFKALEDSDEYVRERATEALDAIDSEAAIPGLLKALEDSDRYVRRAATEALEKASYEVVIPSLLKALKDSNKDVRRDAAESLGKVGSEAAIPGLLKAIEDSDYYVRRTAADALANINSEAVVSILLKSLEDSDYYVRGRAAEALGEIGSEAAIPGLLKSLEDSTHYVRGSVVEALGKIGSEAAIPSLLKSLEDSNYYVRWSTTEALGRVGYEAAIPGLLKVLEDSNWDVRRSATEALGKIGYEAVIPGLLKVLEDSNWDVRRSAAEALGRVGYEAAIPGLLKALEDPNWDVRRSAAEALDHIGSEVAIPGLLKALEHSDEYLRRRAAEALDHIGSEVAIPGLLKALEHSDKYVRRRAAEALDHIGSEVAIPGLLKALEHSDEYLRRRAAEA